MLTGRIFEQSLKGLASWPWNVFNFSQLIFFSCHNVCGNVDMVLLVCCDVYAESRSLFTNINSCSASNIWAPHRVTCWCSCYKAKILGNLVYKFNKVHKMCWFGEKHNKWHINQSSNRKHKNMSHITIMIVIIHHSGPVWPRRSNPEHLGFMTFALIALKTYWWHIIRYINSGVRKKVPTTSSTSNCAQLDYIVWEVIDCSYDVILLILW